jgi:tetratricopeptide (TPR) repeat protein
VKRSSTISYGITKRCWRQPEPSLSRIRTTGRRTTGSVSDIKVQARRRRPLWRIRRLVELSQGDSDTVAALAHAYAATGRKAEAQKILREWLRQSESTYVSPYMIATVYAGLGGKDKAFEYLEKAYQERCPDLTYFLRADLRVDSLRSDPRFQDLMRRMNFPK